MLPPARKSPRLPDGPQTVAVWILPLLLCLAAWPAPSAAFIKVATPELLEKLFGFDVVNGNFNKSLLEPIDLFLEDILPTWLNQAPNNQNGTRVEFKDYNLRDVSNDDAARLTGQELLTRSGFKYELYDAIAEDGYVTQLTRIINPLAERTQLRQPPVLMEHGGTIDPTAYLIASSIQHFPERWPRRAEDGPMRSWNRSLAFQLANNGFDVWLAETRGSNDNNRRHVRTAALGNLLQGRLAVANRTTMEQVNEAMQTINYWAFSQDEIISYELKSHIDSVLRVTGSTKVNLMTFSLSTPTSLAFLAQKPEYAQKVHGFVSMAPIVSGVGTSKLINFLFKSFCTMAPEEVGTLLLTDIMFTQPFRELLMLISKNPQIRYTLFKSLSTLLMGASPKWQTLLDLNLIGHLFRQLSVRELKQMCQQMSSNRLQKYDYGPIKNQLLYNQTKPPLYDLSNIHLETPWIIVSGSNDALSTPQAIKRLLANVNPKPHAHIVAKNFNHLDLFAGWENDIHVNAPILRYYERMSSWPGEPEKQSGAGARELDLASLVPEFLQPEKLIGKTRDVTKQLIPLEPKDFLESLAKGLKAFAESVTGELGKLIVPKFPGLGKRAKSGGEKNGSSEQETAARSDTDATKKTDLEEAPKKALEEQSDKSPLERVMSGFGKSPAGVKNLPALLDPKKFMGQVGEALNNLGGGLGIKRRGDTTATMPSSPTLPGPLGNMLGNLRGLAGGEKKGALGSGLFGLTGSKALGGGSENAAASTGTESVTGLLGSIGKSLGANKSE